MKSDQSQPTTQLIPLRMGQLPKFEIGVFNKSTRLSVPFLTTMEALEQLLPPGFRPAGDPLVIVYFLHNEGVNFLGGRELNILGVNIPSAFEGKEDKEEGSYTPVLWENQTMAIILGREIMGSPKLFGDMENPICIDGTWHGFLSEFGHPLIDVKVGNLKPAPGENLTMIQEMGKKAAWMGWKHIPKENCVDTELSHATYYPVPTTIDRAWIGDGSVTFHHTDPGLNYWNHPVLETLRSLPIVEYMPATMTEGSGKLVISEGRALK